MSLIVVPDKETVIGKAAAIAAGLKRAGVIQLYTLREDMNAVEVVTHSATADFVRDAGGWDDYVSRVMGPFIANGFKQFDPDAKTSKAKTTTLDK